MNRIFKFRAWDIRNKNYVSYFEVTFFNNPEYIVEQHTGYGDINKRAIYEGDIIKYSLYINIPYVEWATGEDKSYNKWIAQENAYVKYYSATFVLYNKDIDRKCQVIRLGSLWDHFEVIGNKNQNPELI